ncbi:hypothetical protein, partial [Singulisphaera acidiphila]|uniref:hypothetical protein n=1 Tax=Singulisphaera acidiphila TaxID=466153 RepID=UPI001ED92F08
ARQPDSIPGEKSRLAEAIKQPGGYLETRQNETGCRPMRGIRCNQRNAEPQFGVSFLRNHFNAKSFEQIPFVGKIDRTASQLLLASKARLRPLPQCLGLVLDDNQLRLDLAGLGLVGRDHATEFRKSLF